MLGLVLLAIPGFAVASDALASHSPSAVRSGPPLADFEQRFLQGMESLEHNRLDTALKQFQQLTQTNPDFRLAQLVYADLLMARAGPIRGFGNQGEQREERLQELLEEAKVRLKHQSHRPPPGTVPEELIYLSPKQPFAMAVDLSHSRLYLFANQPSKAPRLIADYYISSGKNGADKYREGDKKTPLGLYFINDFLPPDELHDKYGAGALTLNYPNEWDQLLNKTGSGIWLHGTPVETYSRAPRASDGCVALTNPDFESLHQQVPLGSPVVLSQSINWINQTEWQKKQEQFLVQVKRWYRDWLHKDPKRILRHYSLDFRNKTDSFSSWSRVLEQRMEASGNLQDAELLDLSILGYPGDQPMVSVTFSQKLKNADGKVEVQKRRQYWRMEWGNRWKIVYEEIG